MAQYGQNKGRRMLVQGLSENEAKIITWFYMSYSTPVNSFMAETTYTPFSCVWAFNGALLYKVFQHTCKFNMIVVFGHQGWTEALTVRMCIIPSRCETNTIIGRVIYVEEYEFVSSFLKWSHLTNILMLCIFRTTCYLCVCTTCLHIQKYSLLGNRVYFWQNWFVQNYLCVQNCRGMFLDIS
jgi:hypothetical protein